MQKSIVYIASEPDEVYKTAYSVLRFLDVYNLKPSPDVALVVYTHRPEMLEAYGSFFNSFELKPLPPDKTKEALVQQIKEDRQNMLYLDANEYPVNTIDHLFSEPAIIDGSIASHKNLKELGSLLKDFFSRYQEESVPNQVKLIHNIDPVKIREEKKAFERLPLPAQWFRKLIGKGWNIRNYRVRI